MAINKTATLTIRVEPDIKEALRTAAQAEHRSIANMLEVLIREHCEKHGIAIVQLRETEKQENKGRVKHDQDS